MGVKYKPGMKVGPKNILFISEIPKEQRKTSQYREGMFLCPDCGKPFRARLANIVSGNTNRCLAHRSEIMAQTMSKDITGQRFGRLTALKWTKEHCCSQRIWKCKCDCGNYTYVSSHHLINRDTESCGCISSKGEALLQNILQELHLTFESQKTFKDCVNPKTSKRLRFDFYLPDYNCCIEYDGEQHFSYAKTKKYLE